MYCTHLIPAQHVKPFVRGNKNDHNDAIATQYGVIVSKGWRKLPQQRLLILEDAENELTPTGRIYVSDLFFIRQRLPREPYRETD